MSTTMTCAGESPPMASEHGHHETYYGQPNTRLGYNQDSLDKMNVRVMDAKGSVRCRYHSQLEKAKNKEMPKRKYYYKAKTNAWDIQDGSGRRGDNDENLLPVDQPFKVNQLDETQWKQNTSGMDNSSEIDDNEISTSTKATNPMIPLKHYSKCIQQLEQLKEEL